MTDSPNLMLAKVSRYTVLSLPDSHIVGLKRAHDKDNDLFCLHVIFSMVAPQVMWNSLLVYMYDILVLLFSLLHMYSISEQC